MYPDCSVESLKIPPASISKILSSRQAWIIPWHQKVEVKRCHLAYQDRMWLCFKICKTHEVTITVSLCWLKTVIQNHTHIFVLMSSYVDVLINSNRLEMTSGTRNIKTSTPNDERPTFNTSAKYFKPTMRIKQLMIGLLHLDDNR